MTDTKDTKVEETPPGYPPGWKPEEIRTIEPQPLPEDQREPEPLHPQQATQLGEIQVLYPHDAVQVWSDKDGWPIFVTPDGEEEPALEPIDDDEKAQEIADKRRVKRSADFKAKTEKAAAEAEREQASADKVARANAEKAEKAESKK